MVDKEKFAVMQELLAELAKIQSIEGSAPIELSIGWVNQNNTVMDNEVIIKKAPPVVAQKLVEQGYSLDIIAAGVRVYKIG